MGKLIKLKISGRGSNTDAPTVDDLLDQVRDYFEILKGVEEAIAENGATSIEWRVVNASKNSPLGLDVEAFPREFGVNIDHEVDAVLFYTAAGLSKLQNSAERPDYFTDKVLSKSKSMFERVNNGLNLTQIDSGVDFPIIDINQALAKSAAANAGKILKPVDRPYKEIGSIEGYYHSVERDGHGRALLFVKYRLTGDIIKCIVSGNAKSKIETQKIGEIWSNRRIQVIGVIHYKALGRVNFVESTDVQFLHPPANPPTIDDIIDRNFTDGERSENYLERLRDGRLS